MKDLPSDLNFFPGAFFNFSRFHGRILQPKKKKKKKEEK